MAETAITAVLSKFGELATKEAKVLVQVGEDMLLLRDRLEWLQAFIRDADRKRRAGTDGLTRVWVRQTRDVAFQAEDALDEFFYKVDLRSQGYRGWKMCRAFLVSCGNQILVRHRLSNQIKRIKSRLNQISENQREFKIEHTPLVASTSSTTATAAWRDDYKNSVGFGDDVQALEEKLLDDQAKRELMFISIVGESGVGKRTLGKFISYKMKGKFELLIRYTVPIGYTPQRLLKGLYSLIKDQCGGEENADNGETMEGSNLADQIRGLLADKRYLLVLGGIGSKTMLNCVRASLPDDNNGSRVMLTLDGENEEVAWHGNTMNRESINGVHQLGRFNKARSALLFRSRAFKKEESDDEEGWTSKYDQIVYEITGGYPLGIVVLAGLLRFKERPCQWEAVLQQLGPSNSGMEAGAEAEDYAEANQIAAQSRESRVKWQMSPQTQLHLSTRTTLERLFWASFEDLPNDLKSCLLYFAAFNKNIGYYADEIVRMWIGEGFVKPQKGKTMEELGHGYLKELVLRCVVETVEMAHGVITGVKVHPRLHGFMQSEIREAGFVDVHDTHHVLVPPSVRRLSFRSFDKKQVSFTKKLPKLRSFICRVEESEQSKDRPPNDLKFLCGSKFLRLIYVNGLKLEKSLPHGIGELIHLRYLYVRCKDRTELPSSIKGLHNLQTLDIRKTQVKKIDPGFWEIKTLRHVLAEELTLPGILGGEELEELQTLHGVKPPGEEGWSQDNCPLRKMTKLRSLELHAIQHQKHGAALEAALNEMCLLVHLKLKGDVIPSCVFTAEALQFLETVELDGIVLWPIVSWDLGKDRPNLVEIKLAERNDAKLEKTGFGFSESERAYRRGQTVAAKHIREEMKDDVASLADEEEEEMDDAVASLADEEEEEMEDAVASLADEEEEEMDDAVASLADEEEAEMDDVDEEE